MNNKNIKDKITNKLTKQNIKGFFQKQGLYVLIFLCLAAAGITAIVAWPREEASPEQIGDSGSGVSMIEAPTLDEELAQNSPTISPSTTITPSPSKSANPEDSTEPAIAQNGSGSIQLTKPVAGQIINEFSGDSLVFYPSLNVWATHNGVDIKAEKGTDVMAALSGTVTDVYSNEADGGVVVITHSNKSETIYVGLEDVCVSKGDKISVGKPVGKVGELPKELDLSYHLHFEYKVDGTWKDPAKYF